MMKPQTFQGWIAAASLALLALPALGQVQPQGHELRVNSRTDFRQQNPVAAFGLAGRALVAWENDQMGLRGQFLNADGTRAGAELTLAANDALSGGSEEQQIGTRREPSLAFLAGGGFLLAWTEGREDVQSSPFIETRNVLDQDVYLQRFDAAGNPAGTRVRVNSTTDGFQRSPQLISRGKGDLLVTWESADGGVFVRTVSATGNVTGHETRINDALGAHPVGAASSLGTALVAWEASDGSGVGIFARIVDPGGQPVGPAFRVNTVTNGRQRRPAVASGSDGSFLVAWQGDLANPLQSRIFAQAVGSHGNLVGPQLTLAKGIGYDVAQMAPALAAAPGGHYLLSWLGWPADGSPEFWMAAAEIDVLGNTVGTPSWITERRVQRNFRRTSIGANGAGGYLLSWESFGDGAQVIDARRLGAH
jgi:large repetitive protein